MAEPERHDHYLLQVPRGTDIDGAIAELHLDADGHLVTMDIRIPARQAASGTAIPMGCLCAYTWGMTEDGSATVVRNGPRGDCPVHGDEDRIRDAMAEAQDHPGRIVSR